MASFQELLKKCLDLGASDIHITAGLPPMYRVDGKLTPGGTEKLTKNQTETLAYSIMTEKQRKFFENEKEVDFSFGAKNIGRFRANVYMQRGCVATSASPGESETSMCTVDCVDHPGGGLSDCLPNMLSSVPFSII